METTTQKLVLLKIAIARTVLSFKGIISPTASRQLSAHQTQLVHKALRVQAQDP